MFVKCGPPFFVDFKMASTPGDGDIMSRARYVSANVRFMWLNRCTCVA